MAERVGVSEGAIRLARAHIAVVERYPEVREEPQSVAIDDAEAVDWEPERS